MTSRTDAELIRAARQDPEAFRELYDRYAVWIRSWFKRHTGSDVASLDLTAECDDYERVEDRSEAGALAPLVRHALRALPADQRRALELRVVHQLPYEAVAGRLGCSQNAARLRVSRALRAITTQLKSAQATSATRGG